MIDAVDRKILTILQKNARETNAQIGRTLKLAPSGILERIRKLEKKGIITGYHATIDAHKLGYSVTAFLFVKTNDLPGDTTTAQQLGEVAEVEEVHHIAGEDCFLVKMRCKSNDDLGRLLRDKIGSIPAVLSTRTSIVLQTVHEAGQLPIAAK